MDNQHQKIKGYRDLSQEEIDLINEVKALAEQCGKMINALDKYCDTDRRSMALARTNLQQGFLWAILAVDKPTTFV